AHFLKILLIAIIWLTVTANSNTTQAKTPDPTQAIGVLENSISNYSQTNMSNYKDISATKQSIKNNSEISPTFAITETTIPDFSANLGNSDHQTVNLSGLNLSENITLTISGANANDFALSQSAILQNDSIAPNTTITVSYSPTTTGTHEATLICSSAGATNLTIPLIGTSGLDNPIASPATDVSQSGFRANWTTVPGATEYLLAVHFIPDNPFEQSSEGFSSGINPPFGWTFTGITATYTNAGIYGAASPSLRFDATGDVVTTPVLPSAATEMKFWLKGLSATGSSLLVEGYDGSSWIQIDNIVTPSSTAKTYLYNATSTPALPYGMIQFRYAYTKVSNNIALDDVSFTYRGSSTLPIEGSPFTVNGATNMEFTGLHEATDYYYSVTAKNATIATAVSNEIHVSTLTTGTDIEKTYTTSDITAANGIIRLTALQGETVEVYNAIGQKLLRQHAKKGLNTISLTARGLLIVRAGNRTAKVIM
ncbi:MAG TPA: hypothetical protein VFK73_02075, partial [Paludibacter sp.]|nr:hypothetical protein [Paludibacter sp.]